MNETRQRHDGPHGLVVEELEVVTTQVQQAADDGEEHHQRNGGRVVGRPQDPDLNLRLLADPTGDGLRGEAHSLDVHRVGALRLAFGREVHQHRRRVQFQLQNLPNFYINSQIIFTFSS